MPKEVSDMLKKNGKWKEIKLIYEIGHISIIIASFLSLLSIGVFAFHF